MGNKCSTLGIEQVMMFKKRMWPNNTTKNHMNNNDIIIGFIFEGLNKKE